MLIPKLQPLWTPKRYKLIYGGRGAVKSWSVAQALIWKAHTEQKRILCTREFQTSIKDSVHKLLKDQITAMGLLGHFTITEKSIIGREHGSEFMFIGLHLNSNEVKSKEGIDIVWLEEAEATTRESLSYLTPTIRKAGSEIWATWNPEEENSAIDEFARKNTPPNSFIQELSWQDNPYFTQELEWERQYTLDRDPDNYDWIWDGGYRKTSAACIFAGKFVVEDFETPTDASFNYGADWGFSNDPTVLMRSFITEVEGGRELNIDHEAFGYGVELDDIPQLFKTIPGADRWPIKGDCSRPETISHVSRKGLNVSAAEKWPGSVEDGIEYLRSFKVIRIHTRCPNMAKEARLYSYKVDKNKVDQKTGQPLVLPIIVDAWNHGWDAVRYSLDGLIKQGIGDNIIAYYEMLKKKAAEEAAGKRPT